MRDAFTPHDFIRSRRSVRRFLSQEVPAETLRRILETAGSAPSAHHRQPWRFAVLSGEASRFRLAEAMGEALRSDLQADGLPVEEIQAQIERSCRRISEAPAAILVSLDLTQLDSYPDAARQQAELLMAVQSVAMAGQNLLLAAHAEGLGAVWMCAPLFAPQAARQALNLPATWQPQGLVLLGYPAKYPQPHTSRDVREITMVVE